MVRRLVLSFIAVLGVMAVAVAQNKQVSGVVTGADGKPIVGATVLVEGSTVGTTTNGSGAYTLTVPANGTLQFSFIGMQNLAVAVAGKNAVDAVLHEDTIGMDAVVVTASGMTRAEKTLGYASTTVKSEEITQGHAPSVLSGMQGKVAGMQITQAGGTGTSQKVIVRGYSSMTGSNQPLFVVDGVPVYNEFRGEKDLNNSMDFGNQASDINPENVESVTVLKGASATALYGSRAANGAVIITTKRGSQNEDVTVTYDGSFMASNVLRVPATQKWFGQGWDYNGTGDNPFSLGSWGSMENGSWGPMFDGREHAWNDSANAMGQADPRMKSYNYVKDNLRNFYETGFETNNNISVSGGSRTTGFKVSYGNTYSDGVLPGSNDYYKRNSFSFHGTTKIKEGKAWLDYTATYVRKDIRNAMTGQGISGSTVYENLIQYPVDINYADLKDYNNIYNNADNFYTPYARNPWWIVDHNYGVYQDDRVYGKLEFGLQLYKGLKAIARLGGDFTNSTEKYYNDRYAAASGSWNDLQGASPERGSYSEKARRWNQIDATVMLNADYKIAQDFSVNAILGWNANQRSSSYLTGSLSGLGLNQWPSFENTSGAIPAATSLVERRRLIGLYGQVDLGYKDFAFLTFSARNDWSSTLPILDNSFFYWGLNASLIVTEMVPSLKKNDILNFLKVRVAYGKTGNDADPYMTSSYYRMAEAYMANSYVKFPLDGVAGLVRAKRIHSSSLQPEISTEAEVGIDLRMFQNRLRVDFAYYNKDTRNQIMTADVAYEVGYETQVRNVGLINNSGYELAVGLTPVRTKNFSWDFTYTFSRNENVVKELWDGVTTYDMTPVNVETRLMAIVGQPLGTWYAPKMETVTDKSSPYYGYTVVDKYGYPVMSSTENDVLGSTSPDFMMGFTNKLRYKNLSLGFTFDWSKGGKMYSRTADILYWNGNAPETAYNWRNDFVYPHAVYQGTDGEYHENNIVFVGNNGNHWSGNNNVSLARDFLLSKSFLKLREVNLSYSLPKKWFEGVKWISGVDVSLVGRNLFLWTHSQGFVDPEITNFGNDLTSEFGEYNAAPSTRTFGGSIKITF